MSDPYRREGTPNLTPRRSTRSLRWWALAMAASWIVGVLWIVLYYLDPGEPLLAGFGNGNLLIGFGLFVLGAVFAVILAVTAIASARRRP